MDLRYERVAIIGGCGFIGTHLSRALAPVSANVTLLDIATLPDDYDTRCTYRRCDIREIDSLRGALKDFDVVFLLAAILELGCSQDPHNGWKTNVLGTANVLEELIATSQCARLVFISTSAVYPADLGIIPCPEDQQRAPVSVYGKSKLAGEELVRVAVQVHKMQAVIFRFFTVYGPGGKGARGHFISRWIEDSTKFNAISIYGSGQQTVDLTHVDDIVRACLSAIDPTVSHPDPVTVYNIGSGFETSICQVAKWFQDEIKDLAVTYDMSASPGHLRRYANINKAMTILGYRPQVKPETGVKALLTQAGAAITKDPELISGG